MPQTCLLRNQARNLRPNRATLYRSLSRSNGIEQKVFSSTNSQTSQVTPLRKQLKDVEKSLRASGNPSTLVKPLTDDVLSQWELTVGIEIHAQLNTARKLFSRASSENEDEPNDKLSAFDISIPGSQPSFQIEALIPALRAAIALNCDIQNVSRFDRKHYFYHDQPAGYQITQYYQPFARDGHITMGDGDGLSHGNVDGTTIGIKQIQLEQDTAKTQELEDGTNLIDFTRSGQPLIEIISLPQIHSPALASAYVRKIQALLYSIDAVTTGMELGGLRADVNVSVRRIGDKHEGMSYGGITGLGQRTEIKNLSSFKAVEDAVKAERDRQIRRLEAGGVVDGETRGWSINNPLETRRLRGKEGEVDYRYLPDPDVPPLYIANDLLRHLRHNLPRTPDQLADMLVDRYGLSTNDAKTLIALDNGERLDYFQRIVHSCTKDPSEYAVVGKLTANWVLHELGSLLATNDVHWSAVKIPFLQMRDIIMFSKENRITGTSAKRILKMVFDGDGRNIELLVEEEGMWFSPMTEMEYSDLANRVLEANSSVVDDIQQKGKLGKIQFLIGQMMRTGDRSRMEASRAESILRLKLFPESS